MADLFLTWEEAQSEQLPHYCVCCAAPATEWADWKICHSQHRVFQINYTYVDVTLPVCPQHRELNRLMFLPRIVVRKIFDDGVLLSHVSPGFVEAVEDYRVEQETLPSAPGPQRLVPGPRPHNRNYDASPAPPRRHPRYDHYNTPPRWSGPKIVALVLAVLIFAPCGLVLIFGLLSLLF